MVVEEEEDVGQWSIQEVEEVMSELAKEMMGSLQVPTPPHHAGEG